jgi:hypothetical protein
LIGSILSPVIASFVANCRQVNLQTTAHNYPTTGCFDLWLYAANHPLFVGHNAVFRQKTDGGAEGVRTPDLLNAIQALYQLSYDPIRGGGECKTSPVFVKTNLNQFELLHFEVPAPDFSLHA